MARFLIGASFVEGSQILFLRRRVPEDGPLKAAVIGAGVFGHHHATKYKALSHTGKDVELFAIADPNADMRAKAKAHHGCSVVADWRELLGRSIWSASARPPSPMPKWCAPS